MMIIAIGYYMILISISYNKHNAISYETILELILT